MTAALTPRRHPALTTLGATVCVGVTGYLLGIAWQHVAGNRMAPWILGRASGIAAYLLMVALVTLGLVLSHPSRARRGGSTPGRIRAHIALALFTGAFVVLHIVVLATDRYAGVGWSGALLPFGSSYRPAAVALGVIGLWLGLLAGLTAAAAGRVPHWLWWPLHKLSAVSLVLVWAHGVLGGGDTPALLALYLGTGGLVLAVAVSRYTAGRTREVAS